MSTLKLYEELAEWWPIFSPPENYDVEAEFFLQTLQGAISPPPRSVVEFGSGGGNIASFFKKQFEMTLVDISAGMLSVSRALNPECEHILGDMRSARLGRQFDAVFVHDAIMYMASEADLLQALETVSAHCKPGGAALLVPDYVRERFSPGTHQGGHDGIGRALRYLQWEFDPDATDNTYIVHWALMLREGNEVHFEHDSHLEGLFPRSVWLHLLNEAGFQAESLIDPYDREIFLALKPTA